MLSALGIVVYCGTDWITFSIEETLKYPSCDTPQGIERCFVKVGNSDYEKKQEIIMHQVISSSSLNLLNNKKSLQSLLILEIIIHVT